MLKFMYNGIKLNGELFKAWYSMGSTRGYAEGTITIYAKNYTSLPQVEGLQIENNSDSMTDYFDKDKIRVTPNNKYYNEVLAAYNKQELHRQKKINKRMGITEEVVIEEVKSVIVEEVKEVAVTVEASNVEGITVEFNEEKNGIEVTFSSKELATEEIRSALKSVGFRWFGKFGKWIARQTPESIAMVNTLFTTAQEELQEVAVIEVSETNAIIKPYSKETLKYVNNICETIIEMDWELQEIKINPEDECIWGLVKKSNGKIEWEGLYAPSYEKTELQEVFNCLNSRIVKDINIDNMEEMKELSTLEEVETEPVKENVTLITQETKQQSTNKTYPEININDIESYTIDKKLSDRENSNSMFRRNDTDHTKEIQKIMQNFNNAILEALQGNTSNYIEHKAKEGLQRFKKKYYDIYVRMLTHRANNPSWAVTGRGGLNVNRYNKKQSQYEKMMGESVSIYNEFNSFVNSIKSMVVRDNKQKIKAEIEKNLSNVKEIKEFKRVRRDIPVDCTENINIATDRKITVASHEYKEYSVIKNWGTFRIYKNGIEVHGMKTYETLEDAKKYVMYLMSINIPVENKQIAAQ